MRLELLSGPAGTRLGHCYQQVPLRVLPPFHFGAGQPALLYLLNPTAGLLDGDGQLVQLSAGAGSRAVVVGQSATRIHPSLHGFSTQQWEVRVEAGAVLVVLPGPAIPFAGCRYYQRVAIDLAPGAGLVWGDVWLAGRYARGARRRSSFSSTTLVQDLTVRREGRLVFRDRFCWQGPWDRATAAWHFGDGTACGSLFVTGAVEEPLTARFRRCEHRSQPRRETPASLVRPGGGRHRLRGGCSAPCGVRPGRRRPATAWLLPNHDLAPNHWFTLAALGHVSNVPP